MDGHESLSFDQMMDKDRAERTKRSYQGLVKHFVRVEFIQTKKPDLVDGESVDLAEVTPEDLKMFFDHVSIKLKRVNVRRDGVFSNLNPVNTVNGKNVLNSASYVTAYRSALKWFYESQGTELPADVMKQLGWYT